MKKYLLTPQGVEAAQAALYRLADDALEPEITALASDPRAWIAAHFELSTYQLEFVRTLPEGLLLTIGLSLAIAIAARQAVRLEDHRNALQSRRCRKAKLSMSMSAMAHFDSHTQEHGTIATVVIRFS